MPNSNEITPGFTPDGRKIAFSSDRDGNPEIYMMNIDGTDLVNLTNDPGADYGPTFKP